MLVLWRATSHLVVLVEEDDDTGILQLCDESEPIMSSSLEELLLKVDIGTTRATLERDDVNRINGF